MIFYFIIFLILLLFSTKRYSSIRSFIPHIIIILLIVLKGQVGCDYAGYLNRYENFEPLWSFKKSKGEFGWYLVEFITNLNQWSYQVYTLSAGMIGGFFLIKAQKNIRYIGFLALIYQMIIVQLGLSGVRQFIAVCILVYAVSLYMFNNQKTLFRFLSLLILAGTFHVSVLSMGFVLPFIFRMKKWHVFFLIIICFFALSTDIITASVDKYNTRYMDNTSFSSGAWIRFFITSMIILLGLKKKNGKIYFLSITILIFGTVLGILNSIALHRFNYYFLPIACMLLILSYRKGLISKRRMNYAYAISIVYFFVWFTQSKYVDCFVPYNVFFNFD